MAARWHAVVDDVIDPTEARFEAIMVGRGMALRSLNVVAAATERGAMLWATYGAASDKFAAFVSYFFFYKNSRKLN
jgi:hypothetical protein